MERVISVKRGDKLAFTLTFTNLTTTLTTLEFAVKKKYTDDEFLIHKSLGSGITSKGDGVYSVEVAASETTIDAGFYPYDVRFSVGTTTNTPLSGYLNVQETVFVDE